jgi:NAD(P)H-flavin reductase
MTTIQTLQREITHANPMVTTPVAVRQIVWETEDTFTLVLNRGEWSARSPFLAGQFNMLYVFGVGEAAISISSDPADQSKCGHTIHRVGSVTTALSTMKRGGVIGMRGPFGTSWPLDIARGNDVCIVAGGIGLAPLRPLLLELFRERRSYGRITVLYGARSPRDLLYRVELEEWAKECDAEILLTVDLGDSSWKGSIGVVTTLFNYVSVAARRTIAYVCGPETMMKFTIAELKQRGLEDERIFLSLERNMKCGIGLCGHCQFGPLFVCKDGPVFPYPRVRHLLQHKEV